MLVKFTWIKKNKKGSVTIIFQCWYKLTNNSNNNDNDNKNNKDNNNNNNKSFRTCLNIHK